MIMNNKTLPDYGDRRSGIDRRRYSYAVYIPERRSNIDRRKGLNEHSQQKEKMQPIKKEKQAIKRRPLKNIEFVRSS
jgi:hypothetical protein